MAEAEGILAVDSAGFAQGEWDALTTALPGLNLLQTWAYAEAKAQTGSWQVERVVVRQRDTVVGAAQALVRHLPGLRRGLVWLNRGPLVRWVDPGDGAARLADVLSALRRHWVDRRGMYLRVAPPSGADAVDARLLEGTGFTVTAVPGWASAVLDLAEPLEKLRAGLRGNWRSQLKQGEQQGVAVRVGSGPTNVEALLGAYRRFLARRGFATTVTPELLERLQALLPADRKLLVFSAERAGEPLGYVAIARYGESCEYLVAAVEDAGRPLRAGNVLLWQAVCTLKSLGCRWFDLGGVDEQRTEKGILHFKTGVGGTPYRYMNEIETHDGSWLSRIVRRRAARGRGGQEA